MSEIMRFDFEQEGAPNDLFLDLFQTNARNIKKKKPHN